MMRLSKLTLAVAALLVLLLAGSIWSSAFGLDAMFGNPSGVACGTAPSPMNFIALSFLALLLGTMIASAGWIFTGLIGSQKYSDFLRNKLWEVFEGVVILTVFSMAFVGLEQYGVQNIDTARTYTVIIRNTVLFDFALTVFASTIFSMFATASPQFRPFGDKIGIYFSFQVQPMFRPIFDLLGTMLQLMTTSIVEWFAHEFMLCFIKNNMLTILLPAGIFLRALGMKASGNALMGVALSLYFVYPYMMVQAGEIISAHFQSELDSAPHMWGCVAADGPICCVPSGVPATISEPYVPNGPNPQFLSNRVSQDKVLSGPIYLKFNNPTSPAIGTGSSCMYNTMLARATRPVVDFVTALPAFMIVLSLLGTGLGVAALNIIMNMANLGWLNVVFMIPAMNLSLAFIYETIYFLIIVSVVMPVFIIFITLTLAKEIAKVLGTEIDLSALEKLI